MPRFSSRLTGHVIISRSGLYFEPPNWLSIRWHERLCTHCRDIDRHGRELDKAAGEGNGNAQHRG